MSYVTRTQYRAKCDRCGRECEYEKGGWPLILDPDIEWWEDTEEADDDAARHNWQTVHNPDGTVTHTCIECRLHDRAAA